MQASELIVQGVRHFLKPFKVPLKPGFNLVQGANEAGKSTLAAALVGSLFPHQLVQSVSALRSGEAAPCRIGLGFEAGGVQYRLLMDLSGGPSSLSRFDPEAKKFVPWLQRLEEIEDFFTSTLSRPSLDVFRRLFAPDLAAPPVVSTGAPEAVPPPPEAAEPVAEPQELEPLEEGDAGWLGAPDPAAGAASGEDLAYLEARASRLREELAMAEQLEKMDFDLQGLQSQLFEAESKLKKLKEAEEAVKKLEDQMGPLKVFETMPEGLESKLDGFKKTDQQKDREMRQLILARDEATEALSGLSSLPFYQEKNFLVGVGLAVVGLVGRVALPMSGASLLPTLTIAGFGAGVLMAGWTLWKSFTASDQVQGLKARVKDLDEKAKMLEKRTEIETGLVRNLMRSSGSATIEQVKDSLNRYRGLAKERDQARSKMQQILKDSPKEGLVDEQKRLKREIEEIEAKQRGLGGLSMDPNEMRRELKEVEGKLGKRAPKRPAPEKAAPKPPPPARGGGSSGMVETCAQILQVRVAQASSDLLEGMGPLVAELTQDRWREPSFADGLPSALEVRSGRRVAWPDMPGSVRHAVQLALHLAAVQLTWDTVPFPLVLDEPVPSFSDALQGIASGLLKRFAARGQAVVFSAHAGLGAGADQKVSLP